MAALIASAASAAWVASAALAADLGYPLGFVVWGEDAAGGMFADRGRDQRRDHWGSRRRAYRHAHRTPVLYSRNQSRTNRALLTVWKGRGGTACRVALYELEMVKDRSLFESQLCYPFHCCDLCLLC